MTGELGSDERRTVVIIGGGDHARVILALIRAAGSYAVGFIEPTGEITEGIKELDGLRRLGGMAELQPGVADAFIVAIGDNQVRADVYERCIQSGILPTGAVHPSAVVLAGAVIAPGAQVCAGAVIGLGAQIHANAIINTAASVDHDNIISAHASVGPGAHLAGRVFVGVGAHVGIGATVKEGIEIGQWALVAAGAVVLHDVSNRDRVAGVPARRMGRTPGE